MDRRQPTYVEHTAAASSRQGTPPPPVDRTVDRPTDRPTDLRDRLRVGRGAFLHGHDFGDGLDGSLVQVGRLQAAVVVDKEVDQNLHGGQGEGSGPDRGGHSEWVDVKSLGLCVKLGGRRIVVWAAAHLRVAADVEQALHRRLHRVRGAVGGRRLHRLEQQQRVERAQLRFEPRPQALQGSRGGELAASAAGGTYRQAWCYMSRVGSRPACCCCSSREA